MQMAPVIPADYAHCDNEALGLVNGKSIGPDGLTLSGRLTPFTPTDKASEVIFKSNLGVPYQASIYFDPFTCVVEDVPAGFTTQVDGVEVAGPVAVFRQWELKGVALCMYGVDSGTNLAFSQDLSGKTVAVNRFKKGSEVVPQAKPGKFAEETEEEKKAREAAAAAATDEATTETETTTTTETETEAEVDPEEEKRKNAAMSDDAEKDETKMSRKELGKKFIGAFGDVHGPSLFAKGLSFAEATAAFTKILQEENKVLKAENAKFKTSGTNGANPVSFSGNTPEVAKFSGLSGGAAKFAAGIKIPTAKR